MNVGLGDVIKRYKTKLLSPLLDEKGRYKVEFIAEIFKTKGHYKAKLLAFILVGKNRYREIKSNKLDDKNKPIVTDDEIAIPFNTLDLWRLMIESPGFQKFIDVFIYIIGAISVVVLIPQLFNILYFQSSEGISLLTWGGMLFCAIFWLLYGAIHRQRPIILTNLGAITLEILIIIATIYYRQGTPLI